MKIKVPFTDYQFELNALKSTDPSPETKRVEVPRESSMHVSTGGLLGTQYNAKSFYEVYRTHSDVKTIIREFQQNVGSGGYYVCYKDDPSKPVDDYIQERISEVLNFRSPMIKLMEWIILDKLIGGNFFGYKVKNVFGEVIGIQRVDPRTMSIVRDEFGDVAKYIQRNYVSDIVMFDPEEILHIQNTVDPDYPSFGMSEIEALFAEVNTDIKAGKRNLAFMKNFTIPGTNFVLKDMSKEQREEMLKFIKEQFQGEENAHKPAVLSGVERIETHSFNNKDMEFLNGRRFSTEKICSAFGTPKSILGYTEGMTFSNVDGMYKKWVKNTIIPEEKVLAQYLGAGILESIEVGLSTQLDFKFNHQVVEDEQHALNEYRSGGLTLRQYKTKTGQQVDDTDESNPNIDTHVIQGSGTTLLEDAGTVGEDPNLIVDATNNLIQKIDQVRDV